MPPAEQKEENVNERITSLKEELLLIRKDISAKDTLYKLGKIREGDYFVSFRRAGGGIVQKDKTVLSIKKLIDIFGYLVVNNEIIPERHRVIKETLQKYSLAAEGSLIEATFKTDTYHIGKQQRIRPMPSLGINEETEFSRISDEQKKIIFRNIVYEIQERMLTLIAGKIKERGLHIKEIDMQYGITAGIEKVRKSSVNLFVMLQPDYMTWNRWFWQRMSKSNSIKAAVIADLKDSVCEIFSKHEFDDACREIKRLNHELVQESPDLMERQGDDYVLKESIAYRLKHIDEENDPKKLEKALLYFSRIKLLEEIIDMPISFRELKRQYETTGELITKIDKSLKILDSCLSGGKSKGYEKESIGKEIEQIEVLAKNALNMLNLDFRNPEFSSDIKFFHDSSSLKIGKYYLVLIDIKNAGLKIRMLHERKVLEYAGGRCSFNGYMHLSFHSYDEFLQEMFENQKTVKAICERFLSEEESSDVLYMAFGDEIFILIPDNQEINHILSEISKKIEVNVRIVSTYFDVGQQINALGSGKQIITAFDALMKGDKVVKDFEKEKEDFRKIILIDQNHSYKLIEEITESLESVEDLFVYTTMVSSGME